MSDVPEGYRMSEVGVIPEEWEVKNILENSTLKARIGWQGLTTAEYLEQGAYYLITGTDFLDGKINWNRCNFVDEKRYVQDKNIQLKSEDVLITKDGTIGKIAYINYLSGKATLNSGIFVIRPKKQEYLPLYFFYVLNSVYFNSFLEQLKAGSTISHLYQKDFISFKFLVPPLPEQRAIASALNDVDALITALGQLITKKRNIKQGAMQQLLSGEKRLPGFDGEWEVKMLENITTEIGDGIHSTPQYILYSDFFFVNGNNLIDNLIKITDNTMCVSEIEYNKHKKKLNLLTILLSINGTIGNIALFNDEKVILGKSAAYININNSVSRSFIFYLLQSSSIKNYFEDELTGSTIRNLSLKTIRNTPILLPPLPEQQAIAQILSDMDSEIESLKQKQGKYKVIKQGMMQELLSGKTRLAKENQT